MRKHTIAAAIAALALCALSASADTATAQNVVDVSPHTIDPSAVQPGSAELRPPMAALGSEYATPTQYAPDGEVGFSLRWLADLVSWLLAAAGITVGGVLTWIVAKVTGKNVDADQARQLVDAGERAMRAAANFVPGAVWDKEVKFKVGSTWVERGLEQLKLLVPERVAQFGGDETARRRLWTYVKLEADEVVPGVEPMELKLPPVSPPPTARRPVVA